MGNSTALDRRLFMARLAGAATLSAGALAGGFLFSAHGCDDGRPSLGKPLDGDRYTKGLSLHPPPFISIAQGKRDGAELTKKAIQALGGMGRFVKPGERVLIKPNVAFDAPPFLGATTSPEVVGEVVKLCLQAGAAKVIVTDNPIHAPEGAFWKSGIKGAVENAGGSILIPGPGDFERIEAPDSKVLKCWELFIKPLRMVDRIIGIAPVKDHNLCGASMGLKNWYGLLGGRRQQFHQVIHQVIPDFLTLFTPTLTILDGTRILMRHGPTGGSPSDVKEGNTVAASIDPVALDAFGWTLLERSEGPPEYIIEAQKRGMGQTGWKGLNPVICGG